MKWKVGDPCIITGINQRGHKEAMIEKIGRKYVTASGQDFDAETGQYRSKDYPFHYHLYSLEQWARKERLGKLGAVWREFSFAKDLENVSDEQIERLTSILRDPSTL